MPTTAIPFVKATACGNDFLLVKDIPSEKAPALARVMCERRSGIGADGLIAYAVDGDKEDSAGSDAQMRIWNSDGSAAEISGNGLRCLAAWLAFNNQALVEGGEIVVATVTGRKSLELLGRNDGQFRFRANMGVPSFADGDEGLELDLAGEKVTGVALSLGNPHFIVFVKQLDRGELLRLGPALSSHSDLGERCGRDIVFGNWLAGRRRGGDRQRKDRPKRASPLPRGCPRGRMEVAGHLLDRRCRHRRSRGILRRSE